MSWKSQYYIKHAFQKFIGMAPAGIKIQEWLKSQRNYTPANLDMEKILQNIRGKVDKFVDLEISPPKRVLEQGTGWNGRDILFFYLAGAEEIATFDTNTWLRHDHFSSCLAHAPHMAKIIANWTGTNAKSVTDRAAHAASLVHLPLAEQLAALNINYRVTRQFDRPQLTDGNFDMVYSDSVLQRMKPADLNAFLTMSKRVLRPGGQHFHVIDCKDFHAITNEAIPFLYYLTWSDNAWNLMTSPYLNYQNRLRMPQFRAAFEEAGFQVEIPMTVVHPASVEYVKQHLCRDPRYSVYKTEEVAISAFELLATRGD